VIVPLVAHVRLSTAGVRSPIQSYSTGRMQRRSQPWPPTTAHWPPV